MDEYIDRGALIEWLKRIRLIDLSDGRGICRVIMEDDFKKAIKKMPKGIIADVAPVRHGRWMNANSRPKTYWRRCTACGGLAYFCGIGCSYKYCPNCGCLMDGGDDE